MGDIRFAIRFLSRTGEVLIDFGQWEDLLSYTDNLSVEGASGTWTLKARVTLGNLDLLKKLHPGAVMECYCARNADPLEGAHRDPSKIKRIDSSPDIPLTAIPQVSASSGATPSLQSQSPKGKEDTIRLIVNEAQRQGITDPKQIAYILATAEHESMFKPIPEFASGSQYEGRSDLGNTRPGDGVRYKGRGFVQLTGRVNYEKYSKLTGKDLVGNPDLALEPNTAAFILVHGMKNGTFTGRKLSDYIGGGNADYHNARRIINGTDRAGLIAGYAQQWQAKVPSYGTTAIPIAAAPSSSQPANVAPTPADVMPEAVKPTEDPYLDKCPYLLLRGIVTDYGRTVDGNSTVISITGESYGKIYKDAFVLTDLKATDTQSQSLEIRNATTAPQGVALIYYYLLKYWVEGFWGSSTGWEARTRVIPFPPNYVTRCNSEGSAWSALQAISIQGFFHIFVDHTGAICWEKLPWSSRSQALIAGRNWEDLPLVDLPSWKIMSWNDRMSGQGLSNFIRCIPTQSGGMAGMTAMAYNMGSIRQYGGPNKREIEFPIGMTQDSYYTSAPVRQQRATNSTFVDLCLLECIRWYDRPVQRVGVSLRGDAAWRIHTKVSITENWSYKDAKPAEYYVSGRSNTIDFIRASWNTQIDLVRDRRQRYLGIGVGEVKVINEALSDPAKQAEKKAIVRFGATPPDAVKPIKPVDKTKGATDAKEPPLKEVELPPEARVPLVPDDYYWFNRFTGKVERIGNDPIAWAKKFVIPKLGEETKPIEIKVPEANTGIASPTGPAAPFTPVDRIYTKGNFYDPSPAPPASYDFTLSRGGSGFWTNDEINTPVPSPVTGVVKEAGVRGGYGNRVEVTGTDGITWLLAHMNSLSVQKGQKVTRGQTLGIQGFTGSVSPPGKNGTHLHVEFFDDRNGGKRLPYSTTRPLLREYFRFVGGGKMPPVDGPTP